MGLGLVAGQDADWDWAFGLVLWFWLPYPLAWALRRWCARAIVEDKVLPGFAARAQIGLWAMFAAGVLENVATLVDAGPWAPAFSAAKWRSRWRGCWW